MAEEARRYDEILGEITDQQAAEFLSQSNNQIPVSCKRKMLANIQLKKEKDAIRSHKKSSSDGHLTKMDIFIFHQLLNQPNHCICVNYILDKINFNRHPQLYFRLNDLYLTFSRFQFYNLGFEILENPNTFKKK